jgi:hypothetical protein
MTTPIETCRAAMSRAAMAGMDWQCECGIHCAHGVVRAHCHPCARATRGPDGATLRAARWLAVRS